MLLELNIDLRDAIEDRVLSFLSLDIVDLQNYTDESLPDGYPRFRVYRFDRPFTTISTWGNEYHTRLMGSIGCYPTLYAAATCWVKNDILKHIEADIEEAIETERRSIPNYF